MKIFLQHKASSLFFEKLDRWTAAYNEAFDFRQARKAIEFAGLYGIDNVRVLVVSVTRAGRVQMLPFEIPEAAIPRASLTALATQNGPPAEAQLRVG
jgi:hypothetical protein